MTGMVTIRMVAQRAGCSVATVSRVANGSARASDDVSRRVLEAIQELGYRPSEVGRSLKTRRSRTIGIVIPSLVNPVFAASVAGIEAAAREAGHSILVTATNYVAGRESDVIATLRAQNAAGLILTVADSDSSADLDRLDRDGVPYVLVYNQPRTSGRAAVTIDNVAAAREMTERLIAGGHRRIAFLAGRLPTSDRSRLRLEGYEAAMQAAGLTPHPVVELEFMDQEPAHRQTVATLLATPDRPTALFASNDILAISVIAALRNLGLRVPEDMSVGGFDGIALGGLMSPSLATVEQPSRLMGQRAMERLFALIAGAEEPSVELFDHIFRPGGSIAAAPAVPCAFPSPNPELPS